MKNTWLESDGALRTTIEFPSFARALSFVNRVGEVAERLQHHPDITILYDKVLLSSTTRDAGSTVTEKDWGLARAIDEI